MTRAFPANAVGAQDIQDALSVAKKIGIEFRVIDLVDEYRARIVNYLIEGYRAGYTPNPDVLCNREMKFGVFLDYALEQGFDSVATGHYARQAGYAAGLLHPARAGPEQGPVLLPVPDAPGPDSPAPCSPWGTC